MLDQRIRGFKGFLLANQTQPSEDVRGQTEPLTCPSVIYLEISKYFKKFQFLKAKTEK